MPTLNELKKQVQELEAQANVQEQEVPVADMEPVPDIMDIADDDPELRGYRVRPDGDVDPLFASIAAHDLTQAKVMVARARRERTLLAAVQDESKLMDERVIAAHQWTEWSATGKRLLERIR